jgi:hypothetical protein
MATGVTALPDQGRDTGNKSEFTKDELRPLAILRGLPDHFLDWLCERGERVSLAKGDSMFRIGEVADSLWIVVGDDR